MSSLTTVAPTNATAPPSGYDSLIGFWLFLIVLIFIMALVTTVVNGLTLYAIYKDPLKCFRNPLAHFMTGVIVADFLTGLIGEPVIGAGFAHQWRTGELLVGTYIVIFGIALACVTITVSFLILLALAVSQLIAISCASRYETSVTVFKAKLAIGLIWVFTILFSIGSTVFSILITLFLLILEIGLITIALVVLYIVSFFIFRKRVGRNDSDENQMINPEVVNKEFLQSTFILIMVQIITVWPYVAINIALAIKPHPPNWVALEFIRLVTIILFLTKFILDPVILVWRLSKYRKSLKIVYAGVLGRCGYAGGDRAVEARAVYTETRQEDIDDEKVNVEVI